MLKNKEQENPVTQVTAKWKSYSNMHIGKIFSIYIFAGIIKRLCFDTNTQQSKKNTFLLYFALKELM